jgi:hypothetical protein
MKIFERAESKIGDTNTYSRFILFPCTLPKKDKVDGRLIYETRWFSKEAIIKKYQEQVIHATWGTVRQNVWIDDSWAD